MTATSTILGAIASVLVLCQWIVFQSIRKYLFQKREPIRRRTAYPVLIGFGLVTILAARLEFGSEIFTPGTYERQLACAIVFSYLGWSLVLALFFIGLAAIDSLIVFKNAVFEPIMAKVVRVFRDKTKRQSGCLETMRTGGQNKRQGERQTPEIRHSPEAAAGTSGPTDFRHFTRRGFFKTAAASGIVVATGLGIEGLAEAYGQAKVEEYELFHHLLNGAAKPVTLLHVTDCHFGWFLGPRELLNLAQILNSLEGDALCLTGDVFHSRRTVVEQATSILRTLRPRPLGNFAVMGNHDFYAGETRSTQSLEAAGFTILRNRWMSFKIDDSTIHFGGVDDPEGHPAAEDQFPGLNGLIEAASREAGFRILLSHRPGVFPQAAKSGIDLTLAGHLHGGQIVMPVPGRETGISVADALSEYTYGWYKKDAASMYVSRGVGMAFLPWRICCSPEIAVIRLRPAQEGASNVLSRRIR